MRELCRGANFALEAGQHLRIAGSIGANHFHRTGPLQHLVLGQIDVAHAAGAQLLLEPILAQLLRRKGLATQCADRVNSDRPDQHRRQNASRADR